MEMKWLEDFLVLAETRNFSKSAISRHVTQSAFSRRIRSLEVWLGVPLLDRSTYPVSLTEEGRQFRETAEEMVRMLALARSDLRSRNNVSDGQGIAVTGLHTLCLTFLPTWLAEVETTFGPTRSRVLPDNLDICVQALIDGGYDVLLTYHNPSVVMPLDPSEHLHQVVGHDVLSAVVSPPDRRRWRKESGSFPLLQYSRGSFLGLMASVAQGQEGAPKTFPAHRNENSMAEGLKSMAIAGHGLAWLPRSLVRREVAAGDLVVVGPDMPMEIRLYRSRNRSRAFLERVWRAAGTFDKPDYATSE